MQIHTRCLVYVLASMIGYAAGAADRDGRANPKLGPDEVENQITQDRQTNPIYASRLLAPLKDWRNGLAERTGLNFSIDYSTLYVKASDSPGEDDAAGGMVRFFGFWHLVGRDGPNKGSLNWKLEHRHRYTDIPPKDLGFASGYVGLHGPPFSNDETRLTNLYWKQYLADGKFALVAGFLDATDFVDVYLIASPWTGFTNFMFSTGSGAMDLPNDATLAIAAGGMLTKNLYAQAGIADANSDPTDPFDGFDTTFNESDFFKWVEIGFTPSQDKLYFDNIHLTFWHVDERLNGTPSGWGLNASWQQWFADKWLPFVRGGYTEDSGSLLEKSVSAGVGYQPIPGRGVIAAGLNWGEPNQVSFAGADKQLTSELFWRVQLTKELAVTPAVQYIKDPALNPAESSQWVVSLRARLAF